MASPDRTLRAGVELHTRRFLEGLIASGDLDRPSVGLLQEALARAADAHPGAFVHLLADALGAPPEAALEAGSLAQMFYAAASLTDDLQDADQADALARRDPRLQLNALAQLLCATAARAASLSRAVGDRGAVAALSATFQAGVAMLTGQRLELAGGTWTSARYRKVAELSAGRQFEAYLAMSALAAGASPARLTGLGRPLGLLLQLHHDLRTRDRRVRGLSSRSIGTLRSAARRQLRAGLDRAPRAARRCLRSFAAPLLGGKAGLGRGS
ncbi:MAG TPA: hypothetical protein VGK67_33040 [Myxococcales bacterium]